MNRRVLVIIILCMLVWFPIHGLTAYADTPQLTGEKQFQTNFADTVLTGGITYTQQYVQLESYWNVTSFDIHLDYQISQLLRIERSSVTVFVNGTPIHSFRPKQEDTGLQQLTIPVPKTALIPGINTIMVQGHLETTSPVADHVCLPTDTRDNWLQIAKSSRITVRYVPELNSTRIGDFYERFIGLDTVKNGENAIAVALDSEPAELEAATYALSGLAKANKVTDKPIPLVPYSDALFQQKQMVILIANYDHLPEMWKPVRDETDLDQNALIQLQEAGGHSVLVVTSKDAALLVKAGRFIANTSLLSQVSEARIAISNNTEVDTPPVNVSSQMSLTETGDKLTGDRHREKAYFISLPGNRSIAEGSKLRINYRYARNVDWDRSLVTVLINDSPIGSKKLSTELADADHLELTIPKTLNISGNFTIKVAFDLELKNAGCIENQDQMPWAYIEKDSILQLNTKDRTDLLFNNYPYPFLRDGSYNQVAVVLPDQRDTYLYQTLTNVFNLLGRYAQTNTGEVLFYQDTVKESLLKGREIIAIGSPQANSIIKVNNRSLYFQYDSAGQGFVSNEKMSIESSYGKRIGSLQLLDSPYEQGYGMLALTGSTPEYTYLASKLIGSEGSLWKVFGDGAVTDKDGHVQAFRFKKTTTKQPSNVISDVLERKDVLGFMTAATLVVLLVIISLLLMLRKYKKKRRDRG
ncbi:cellulose biosynthesis cyclic di-GMP-binding regulatory protein BcsB [Paenibacillus roseipurpureus]|uniref:Cellulose biosynthesis cyclic di-GMP-binding regulatory protein BcsB n=1 Tax=Paenibacillus roseopurpureus TaxID=2918901 RepID=A0AA96RIP6_9BACL|nr:cellulose biosynthesis cyclic di-GMP-binding regulatory protein BcsB [Paenibacillus sp. MBLB1832]WNR42321.1 cellulose biosynthesis cyclic di-GMP-binding regulatory protein BcsB [Paenibacillus sp. MBLB1832]